MAARKNGGTALLVEDDPQDAPEGSTDETPQDAPKEKGLLHYLGLALSGALLVAVLAIAVLVIALPAIVGGAALTVLTNSMAPKLPPGTLIIIKPTHVDEIRVGDVLTYQIKSGQAAVITHRVVTRSVNLEGESTFITKGDNNDLADEKLVRAVQVKGTLWYAIPYLGYVNNLVNGETRPLVTPILAGLLFAYAAFTVISSIVGKGKRRKQAVAASGDILPTPVGEITAQDLFEPRQYDPDISA